jgi:hypothetical protein
MPSIQAKARLADHPVHGRFVEVNVTVVFEDKPPQGTVASKPWPMSPQDRTSLFDDLVMFCAKHNVDYANDVKPAVLEALEHPTDEREEVQVGEPILPEGSDDEPPVALPEIEADLPPIPPAVKAEIEILGEKLVKENHLEPFMPGEPQGVSVDDLDKMRGKA